MVYKSGKYEYKPVAMGIKAHGIRLTKLFHDVKQPFHDVEWLFHDVEWLFHVVE